MAETRKLLQASVKYPPWLRHIIKTAKNYVETIDGDGLTANDFFVSSAGIRATQILKDIGCYEATKERWEKSNGPVDEYDTPTEGSGD